VLQEGLCEWTLTTLSRLACIGDAVFVAVGDGNVSIGPVAVSGVWSVWASRMMFGYEESVQCLGMR
jgi:hypothetical protein